MSLDALGRTRDTMVGTEGRKTVRWSKSQKPTSVRIEVCNDLMKPELLVIVGQPYHGEYVLESCTHRPSTQGSWEYPTLRFMRGYGKLNDRE